MANWWDAAPVVEKGGDDWWQSAPVVEGTPAPKPEGEWKTPGDGEPGIPIISDLTRSLYPLERNTETGEMRLAVPKIVTEALKASEVVGKAATGQYGMEIDPATGRPTTITDEMLADAMAAAGMASPGTPGVGGAALGSATGNALTGAAARNVRRALRHDGVIPADIPARLRALGPDAVIADLGPNLQAQAQAIATMPGAGQKVVVDTLKARQAGRNERIIGGVNETLGPAPIPSRLAAENLANRQALEPEYAAAINGATAVDSAPIALNLDSEVVNLRGPAQRAVRQVRDMLNVVGTDQLDPNPRTLLEVRKAIDGLLAGETDTNVIRVLGNARREVDAELANKVPRIKEVDAKYEELARQEEAVGTGQRALDGGRTALQPEELVDLFATSAVPERGIGPSAVPFRVTQGARAEIERLIGTTANDLNALKTALKGDGSWNRDRLATLYGQQKADELLSILEREVAYSATEGAALGGSRTQVLKAAQDEVNGVTKKPGFFQNALNFNGGSAIAALGDKSLGWVGRGRRRATGAAMADYLMSVDGSNMLRPSPGLGSRALGTVDATARATPTLSLRELMVNGGPKAGETVRIEM